MINSLIFIIRLNDIGEIEAELVYNNLKYLNVLTNF